MGPLFDEIKLRFDILADFVQIKMFSIKILIQNCLLRCKMNQLRFPIERKATKT